MSSCVICLVAAREIFLLSDFSAITKVHIIKLTLLLTCFVNKR